MGNQPDVTKIVAMAKQVESCMSTTTNKVEQIETKHDNLNAFVTQLSNSMNKQQARTSGTIPSNTIMNPKALNAISLRSGKQVRFQGEQEEEEEEEIEVIICEGPDFGSHPSTALIKFSESSKEKGLLSKTTEGSTEPARSKAQTKPTNQGTAQQKGNENQAPATKAKR